MRILLRKSILPVLLLLVALGDAALAQTPSDAATKSVSPPAAISFTRSYREGETLAYHMKATNKGRDQTKAYEADVHCIVKKAAAGPFTEECAWSNLVVNGKPEELSPAARNLRQILSLDPAATPSIPDLSQVIPLIGPITDLLTFYADLWLAIRTNQLHLPGDHFYVPIGTPNSWADGNYVILGQDSIDFDLTFAESQQGIATLLVRHVPPAKPQIKLPADWMTQPVADSPNNWLEVAKSAPSEFSARVGKETFDVRLKVAGDGKILSATLYNPVEVLQRDCTDAALTACGASTRYQILRRIELTMVQ